MQKTLSGIIAANSAAAVASLMIEGEESFFINLKNEEAVRVFSALRDIYPYYGGAICGEYQLMYK